MPGRLAEQFVEGVQPILLVAVAARQAAGLDEGCGGAEQRAVLGVASEQQALDALRVVQLFVVDAEQQVTIAEQELQRARVVVAAAAGDEQLEPLAAGLAAKLVEEEFAVLAVEHADALDARQDQARQAELAGRRRVAPEYAETSDAVSAMSVGAWQQALAIDPVEQQRQGRRRPVLAQAPGQGLGAEQEQAGVVGEDHPLRQGRGRAQFHLVLRPSLRQGIAKGVHRGPWLALTRTSCAASPTCGRQQKTSASSAWKARRAGRKRRI